MQICLLKIIHKVTISSIENIKNTAEKLIISLLQLIQNLYGNFLQNLTLLPGCPLLEQLFTVISRVVADAMLGTKAFSTVPRLQFIQHYQLRHLHHALCDDTTHQLNKL